MIIRFQPVTVIQSPGRRLLLTGRLFCTLAARREPYRFGCTFPWLIDITNARPETVWLDEVVPRGADYIVRREAVSDHIGLMAEQEMKNTFFASVAFPVRILIFSSPFVTGVRLPQRSCWDEVYDSPQGEISDDVRWANLTKALQDAFIGYVDPALRDEALVVVVDEVRRG
jgi:hypothetical protein